MNQLQTSLLFFYTETPLHAGSGAGMGAIDLPLQRERMSELPQVQGSGVKGALRELFRAEAGDDEAFADELELFGPRAPDPNGSTTDTDIGKTQAHEHAGALAVTDARLLLLPARSARGGWAWLTAPLILQRLARDLCCTAGIETTPAWAELEPRSDQALVASADAAVVSGEHLIVEDAAYRVEVDTRVGALAQLICSGLPDAPVYEPVRRRLGAQLVVISDEEMGYWARHATEVVTRVRINPKTGTVDEGALWTEELLPSESLMWSVIMISAGRGQKRREATALEQRFSTRLETRRRVCLGGDRTVGRGLVALGRIGAQR